MQNDKMIQALNEQVNKEFYSAYLYLAMQAYFLSINLDGFANFFKVQVQEERDHALGFFNYINKIGGKIVFAEIQKPQSEFSGPLEVFDLTLKHEQSVTHSIYTLMDIAKEVKDHTTEIFLQWFISEQAEEEENVSRILNKLKLIKGDGAGLFMIDNELAQRMYVPAVIPV
ncbi:ferritin-like protein [Desulfosporosinus orientis DSM 765]|uniref:Ferritin n=1 Tax=Desulfosporosinus orientis (strain ATCC 19365 / DSM 765 / NCIMB 8382 / VKM B-1628 / Singapore I) TaxID=768706 RepID=G7WAQ2_DESOD|nr:ferritin [Desulfosporosinus orientis]AET67113.1 ferritin-like protein [Desulfosporosinus orientis DSM 765]